MSLQEWMTWKIKRYFLHSCHPWYPYQTIWNDITKQPDCKVMDEFGNCITDEGNTFSTSAIKHINKWRIKQDVCHKEREPFLFSWEGKI